MTQKIRNGATRAPCFSQFLPACLANCLLRNVEQVSVQQILTRLSPLLLSLALSACGGMIVFDTPRRPNNIFDEALRDHSGAEADQEVNRRLLERFPPGSNVQELVGYLTSLESQCWEESSANDDVFICKNTSWTEYRTISIVFLIPFESDRRRSMHNYLVKIFFADGKTQGIFVWNDPRLK